MSFDPDAYLGIQQPAQDFDPNAYLGIEQAPAQRPASESIAQGRRAADELSSIVEQNDRIARLDAARSRGEALAREQARNAEIDRRLGVLGQAFVGNPTAISEVAKDFAASPIGQTVVEAAPPIATTIALGPASLTPPGIATIMGAGALGTAARQSLQGKDVLEPANLVESGVTGLISPIGVGPLRAAGGLRSALGAGLREGVGVGAALEAGRGVSQTMRGEEYSPDSQTAMNFLVAGGLATGGRALERGLAPQVPKIEPAPATAAGDMAQAANQIKQQGGANAQATLTQLSMGQADAGLREIVPPAVEPSPLDDFVAGVRREQNTAPAAKERILQQLVDDVSLSEAQRDAARLGLPVDSKITETARRRVLKVRQGAKDVDEAIEKLTTRLEGSTPAPLGEVRPTTQERRATPAAETEAFNARVKESFDALTEKGVPAKDARQVARALAGTTDPQEYQLIYQGALERFGKAEKIAPRARATTRQLRNLQELSPEAIGVPPAARPDVDELASELGQQQSSAARAAERSAYETEVQLRSAEDADIRDAVALQGAGGEVQQAVALTQQRAYADRLRRSVDLLQREGLPVSASRALAAASSPEEYTFILSELRSRFAAPRQAASAPRRAALRNLEDLTPEAVGITPASVLPEPTPISNALPEPTTASRPLEIEQAQAIQETPQVQAQAPRVDRRQLLRERAAATKLAKKPKLVPVDEPLPDFSSSPDLETSKRLLTPNQLKEVEELERLQYMSVARQGPETGYKAFPMTAAQKARMRELGQKYRSMYVRPASSPETPILPAGENVPVSENAGLAATPKPRPLSMRERERLGFLDRKFTRTALSEAEEAERRGLRGRARAMGEAGFVSPAVLANVAAPIAGAAAGATQGETMEERFQNALIGAGLASGVTAGLTAARNRFTPTERYRQIATGRDGMPNWYLKWRRAPAIVSVRTGLRDVRTRIKDAVSLADIVKKVKDDANPFLAGKLFPGRVKPRVDAANEAAANIERQLVEAAKAGGYDRNAFVGGYESYLAAKHGPEYNKNVITEDGSPASGFTDEMWEGILDGFRKDGRLAVYDDIAAQHRPIINEILDTLVDGGVISAELRKALRERYPNYVPFNRRMGTDDQMDNIVAQVFGDPDYPLEPIGTEGPSSVGGRSGARVTATGLRKAKGSDRPIENVNGNILRNLQDAIVRAEKNKVARATLEFVRNHGEFIPGGATIRTMKPGEALNAQKKVVARIDGQPFVVDFKDPNMNIAAYTLGGDALPTIFRWMANLNRWRAGLLTRFSPNFLVSNVIRDKQEAAINAFSQGDWAGGLKLLNPASTLTQDMAAVIQHSRKVDTPQTRLYDQMIQDGALTGGVGFAKADDAMKAIDEIRAEAKPGSARATAAFLRFVDALNEVAENSTRFRVYRNALEQGASREQAAIAARDATVDFNMKGSATNQLSSIKMFINPALQGPVNNLKAVIRSPRTMGIVATSLLGTGLLLDEWNKSYDPQWKERPEIKLDRTRGIPIIYGKNADGSLAYHNLPIAIGLRPLKAIVDFSQDLSVGDIKDTYGALDRMRRVFLESLNPLGASSLENPLSAFMPSFLEPVFEMQTNLRGGEVPIVPPRVADDKTTQDRMKRSPRFMQEPEGKAYAAVTDFMYDMIGADVSPQRMQFIVQSYLGGPYRTASELASLAKKAISGDAEISPSEIPILSAIERVADADIRKIDSREYRETLERLKESNRQIGVETEKAKVLVADMLNAGQTPQEWAAYLGQAAKEGRVEQNNPLFMRALANQIKEAQKQKDDVDRLIGQFPVYSGDRARYYLERRSEMTPEAYAKFLQEQAGKGLLTQDVFRQMQALSQQR